MTSFGASKKMVLQLIKNHCKILLFLFVCLVDHRNIINEECFFSAQVTCHTAVMTNESVSSGMAMKV